MQLSGAALLKQFWTVCQRTLFPVLEEELGPLTKQHELLISAFSLLKLHNAGGERCRLRRPRYDRVAIARSFLAKSCFKLPTTRHLIERLRVDSTLRRLCGWSSRRSIPSESVFSRSFDEIARSGVLEEAQKALVDTTFQGRIVGHIIRDGTAVPAHEKPARKKPETKVKRPRGRPRKDEAAAPKRRLELQAGMTCEQMLADLPKACDRGVKIGTDGRKYSWTGYKLHWDVTDSGIPLTCLVTSASTHDSQAAIPLATLSSQRVDACYELMDAGYHSEDIKNYCEKLGHVVLIPDVGRQNKEALPMAPAAKQRYNQRSLIERLNARLKDEFGGNYLRVRGHHKVTAHLMFGVLVLMVDQLRLLARC